MTYEQTLQWMFSRLPMFQRQGASAYRKDLNNIRNLTKHLGNPESGFRSVHVAGTNGKGSTSHMLASIFMQAGYKTGLYTSPHLKDFRERIRINGKTVREDFVVSFIENHREFFERSDMSFFEMTVGMAFTYFRDQQVDIAIIETGMGGRLDATNIITPELSVVTNIGLDHTQFLGESSQLIAVEKSGIIKEGVPVVIGEASEEIGKIFIEKAKSSHSEIIFAEDLKQCEFDSDLTGAYQTKNRQTVYASVEMLRKRGWIISDTDLAEGFKRTTGNTGLQGRWQQLREKPTVIADTAHNSHGLQATLPQIFAYTFDRLHIVLGTVNDKNLDEILPLFPGEAAYYFCKPDIPRGLEADILAQEAAKWGLAGNTYDSVTDAYRAAIRDASESDFIYVGGSTFVVAEIL